MFGIGLEQGHNTERLGIALEAAVLPHHVVQRYLAAVAEGGVADIVGQTQAFHQAGRRQQLAKPGLLDLELGNNPGANLRGFERVGQAGAVEVVVAGTVDLGFGLEPAEGGRMQDPGPITLVGRTVVITADFLLVAFAAFPLGAEVKFCH